MKAAAQDGAAFWTRRKCRFRACCASPKPPVATMGGEQERSAYGALVELSYLLPWWLFPLSLTLGAAVTVAGLLYDRRHRRRRR